MNYKNHKYNNTVIEVLDREHGKQAIKWWEDQGVDTGIHHGIPNKADKDTYRYYGLIDGIFGFYTLQNCIDYIIQIITLPMESVPEQPQMESVPKQPYKDIFLKDIVLNDLESELSRCTHARDYLNTVEFIESLDCNNVLMYLKGREDALIIAINKLN